MTPKTSYVLVGLFVLMLGAALIAAILWLTTGGAPRDYDFYHVYFTDSVTGLSIDAAVKYKGVNRGRVREIVLDPEDPEQVRVLLVVLQDTPVNADTVATLESQGLTGIATINLSGGNSASAPLEIPDGAPYPVIQSRPSLLNRLDQSVSQLVASFLETSQRFNSLLDDNNRANISTALANMTELSERLNQRAAQFDAVMNNADGFITDLRRASVALPDMIEKISASAEEFERMSTNLAAAGETFDETGRMLQETVSETGGDLQRFSATTLPRADSLVSELNFAAQNLRQLSEMLERDPSVVLFGAPEPVPGPGEEGAQ